DEFPDNVELLAHRDFLDGSADVAEPRAFMHDFNRAAQSSLGHAQQPLGAVVDHSHGDGKCRVPHPALLDHADVELHDVAILNTSLTADSVHDLVVERNANVAGKYRMPQQVTN